MTLRANRLWENRKGEANACITTDRRPSPHPPRRHLCLMVGLALSGIAGEVRATDYVVTSSGDSVTFDGNTNDTTTLRYALILANAAGGLNTITFSPEVSAPILLEAPLPLILNNLTIDGSGAQGGKLTMDGNHARLLRASSTKQHAAM